MRARRRASEDKKLKKEISTKKSPTTKNLLNKSPDKLAALSSQMLQLDRQNLNAMTPFQLRQTSSEQQPSEQQTAEPIVRSEKIKVAVRVRPFLPKEIAKENVIYISKNGKQIRVSDMTHTTESTYDKVFEQDTTQSEAYQFVSDCIPNLLQGFNCTIFAYGQTGTGKTYTMFGDDGAFKKRNNPLVQSQLNMGQKQLSEDVAKLRRSYDAENFDAQTLGGDLAKRGIIPRCISDLFQQIKAQGMKYTIYCSFLQIYNEKLYDLLQDTYTKNPLQIREEKFQGIFVEGLSEYVVQDETDCLKLLIRGEKNRIKRQTHMNIRSSRSHTLFQLLLETDKVDAKGMLKRSKLNLGDLAGSEKINKDEEMKAKHMLELRNINLSLTTLGKVIQILSAGGVQNHVPFRESKLTRLLQDSIGGNCQTYLIATVSPVMDSIEETISTLKFADRAKCVMQRVRKNEINAKDDLLVQKLQKEVTYLKELLQMKRQGFNPKDVSHQLFLLKDENERLRQIALNYQDVEKMKEENKLMRIELQKLRIIAASDGGSLWNGDQSPRSNLNFFNGRENMMNSGQRKQVNFDNENFTDQASQLLSSIKKPQIMKDNSQKQDGDESDESINEQFNNYKTEMNLEIQQDFIATKNSQTKTLNALQTERNGNITSRGQHDRIRQNFETQEDTTAILSKQRDIASLKHQKERLQNVIADKHLIKQIDSSNNPQYFVQLKVKQPFNIKKRYKEGDLSDEPSSQVYYKLHNMSSQNSNITLPQINESVTLQNSNQPVLYQKVDLSRKSSNSLIPTALQHQNSGSQQHNKSSPYSLNRTNGTNPSLKQNESYLSDFVVKNPQQFQPQHIQKYPNRQGNMRLSIGSNEDLPTFGPNQSHQMVQIAKDVNNTYQIASSGMVAMTTQSSLYGASGGSATYFNPSSNMTHFKNNLNHSQHQSSNSPQTLVRIRGRHNKLVEHRGNIMITLEEEKKAQEKQKQLRRSNERLRMLETIEKSRQEKMERDIQRLEDDRVKRQLEEQRKRDLIKSKRLLQVSIANKEKEILQQVSQDNNFHQRRVSISRTQETSQSQTEEYGRGALIPRSQVLDVLKNLNIREGLFSEEELRQMENGFSVSESGDGADDLMSLRSGHSGIDAVGVGSLSSPVPGGAEGYDHYSRISRPQIMRGGPQSNLGGVDGFADQEQRLRFNQERSMLHSEIANQKSKYLKKMTNLERLLDQLKSEKRELQQVIETQKQNFKLQLMQQDQRTQAQLQEIKDQQTKLQGQVPNFKEKLDLYKKEFSNANLVISEEQYVELKARPRQEDLSLKEFLQVKIYESLDKYLHEIENLRRENDEITEINMQDKLQMDRDKRELDNMRKIMREREEDSRRKTDSMERRIKELESDLHKINGQYKILMEKGLQQKDVDDQFRQLEVDYRSLQNQHKMLEQQMQRVQDLKTDSDRQKDSLRRELDLLNQDKTFLTRENVSLEERIKRLEEKLDRNETELLEAKRQAAKYMDRVISQQDEVRGKFEREYGQEVQELKERHTRELELAKSNLTEIYEKRIEYMRERKEEYERRCLKLEQDYSDKARSYDELLVELRQLQRNTDEEIGRLKLGCLSKGDELLRITHLYEDNMVLVKDLKIENESLRSKIDVLKSEYYKLESQARQGNADIKAELAVCKERLGNYELIEKELDQAIMNVANNENIDGEGVDSIGSALIQTITSAPTTAKRRIQQSLLLANRLQTKQKENETLLKEIKELKEKLENQESEVKFHKRLMEKSGQPASYMMQDIEKAEKELQFAQKKIRKLEDEIKRLNKENEQLVLQKKGLSEDLQKLISRRQDIENLYTTLQGIITHSSAKKIDIEELKHKLADSIRSQTYKNQSNALGKENSIMRKLNKSRSRSPKNQFYASDEIPEKGSAVKMYQETDNVPSWYKALKKQVNK